eukprot:5103537-Lingulodinium_polyedra.AAC.1
MEPVLTPWTRCSRAPRGRSWFPARAAARGPGPCTVSRRRSAVSSTLPWLRSLRSPGRECSTPTASTCATAS